MPSSCLPRDAQQPYSPSCHMVQFLHIISNSWVMLGLQIVQRGFQRKSFILQVHGLLPERREWCWLIAVLLKCALPCQLCCKLAVCLCTLHKELDVVSSIQHPPATVGAFHPDGHGQVCIQYGRVHGFYYIVQRIKMRRVKSARLGHTNPTRERLQD